MEVNNLVVTTLKKSVESTTQLTSYIDELGHILVHMVENIRDEWICGCNCTRMNEGKGNTFGPLMCENDVSYFHMEL
jgi:hypothetical protein